MNRIYRSLEKLFIKSFPRTLQKFLVIYEAQLRKYIKVFGGDLEGCFYKNIPLSEQSLTF